MNNELWVMVDTSLLETLFEKIALEIRQAHEF